MRSINYWALWLCAGVFSHRTYVIYCWRRMVSLFVRPLTVRCVSLGLETLNGYRTYSLCCQIGVNYSTLASGHTCVSIMSTTSLQIELQHTYNVFILT